MCTLECASEECEFIWLEGEKECARDISARGLGSEQSPDPCRSVQRAGLTSGPASWAHQRCRPKVATCPSSRATPTAKGGGEALARARSASYTRTGAACAAGWISASCTAISDSTTAALAAAAELPRAQRDHLHPTPTLHLNLHTVVGVPPLSRVPARSLVLSKPQTSPIFW